MGVSANGNNNGKGISALDSNNGGRVVKSYLLKAGVEWLNPSPSYTPLPIRGECIPAIPISLPIVWVEYHEH